MKPEDKTSITVSKDTRRDLESLKRKVAADLDQSLSQDDLLKILMDFYKSHN
jgi:5-bromo-4-chloroindolyl phosphate hydrolysis protein